MSQKEHMLLLSAHVHTGGQYMTYNDVIGSVALVFKDDWRV